jgi:hypothetical protein
MKQQRISRDEAWTLGVKAVEFLFADAARTDRFMKLTGLGPEAARAGLAEPQFLTGILDYLLADESLLFEFSTFAHAPVTMTQQARHALANNETAKGGS